MHCYAPNLEEVEGANWFGPVHLSTHLPPLPPGLATYFFKIWILCEKKFAYASPSPPPLPGQNKKEFFLLIWIHSIKIHSKKNALTPAPRPPLPPSPLTNPPPPPQKKKLDLDSCTYSSTPPPTTPPPPPCRFFV